MNRKAIIFGIKGTKLTYEEKTLIKRERPWGIILFSRNINNLNQVYKLTSKIRKIIGDKHYPILIDQEGGKISRLDKIMNFSLFSQCYFGRLYETDKKNFFQYYNIYVHSVSKLLRKAGINVNTVPVLDVYRKKSHNIIGERSYSSNTNLVTRIGNICTKLFHKNKIATIMKHIPGHGLSKVDSHKKTPVIKSDKKKLIENDFKPFKYNNAFFAMTAHVIYENYDPIFTATHSKIIIEKIIRKHIGFKGLIISDDIMMKSLNLGLKKNTTLALDSGCNLILHCNGKINEMSKLAKIVPKIDNFTSKKTSQFYKFLI